MQPTVLSVLRNEIVSKDAGMCLLCWSVRQCLIASYFLLVQPCRSYLSVAVTDFFKSLGCGEYDCGYVLGCFSSGNIEYSIAMYSTDSTVTSLMKSCPCRGCVPQ